MAIVNGKSFYTVPATGQMTSANVLSTCKAAGMTASCNHPAHGDSKCTQVVTNYIWSDMRDLLCNGLKGGDYLKCKPLQNIFVYMTKIGTWGEGGYESYGVVDEKLVHGRDHVDKFALCVG